MKDDEISVQELAEKMNADPKTLVVDVREPDEHEEVNIGGLLIPMGTVPQDFQKIPKDVPVYLYCRSGNRSRKVLEFLKTKGYSNCYNVVGGMLSWMEEIDPEGWKAP